MKTLIFDTETTGIVNFKTPDHTKQPFPVQLACILVQDDRIMNMVSVIVTPGVEIPDEASKVHGITKETADTLGLSLRAATGIFLNFLNKADRIVGHNIDFDLVITEAMIYRTLADYDMDKYREKPRVCTMLSAKDQCKLPGKYGYKWPTLEEAYKILVNPKGFEGAHDALSDVMACWHVLRALEAKGLPLLRGKK